MSSISRYLPTFHDGFDFYSSEYNTNFAKSMKGERAPPAWLSDFEKVTIE